MKTTHKQVDNNECEHKTNFDYTTQIFKCEICGKEKSILNIDETIEKDEKLHSALDSVREYVQAMREEGEGDLRSILSFIDELKKNN